MDQKRSGIFVLIFFGFVILVYAASDFYPVGSGSTVTIDEHGTCKKVTNNNALGIFVPTKSAAEWQAFRDNSGSVATLEDCSGGFWWGAVDAFNCFDLYGQPCSTSPIPGPACPGYGSPGDPDGEICSSTGGNCYFWSGFGDTFYEYICTNTNWGLAFSGESCTDLGLPDCSSIPPNDRCPGFGTPASPDGDRCYTDNQPDNWCRYWDGGGGLYDTYVCS